MASTFEIGDITENSPKEYQITGKENSAATAE
jgi:hypothetical protein